MPQFAYKHNPKRSRQNLLHNSATDLCSKVLAAGLAIDDRKFGLLLSPSKDPRDHRPGMYDGKFLVEPSRLDEDIHHFAQSKLYKVTIKSTMVDKRRTEMQEKDRAQHITNQRPGICVGKFLVGP